jgi:hypothetical protein
MPQPQASLILGRAGLLIGSAVALLIGNGGCGSANPNLFDSGPGPAIGGSSAGNASFAGSWGMQAGSGNGGENPASSAGNVGSGGSGAGCAFFCGDGGRGGSGNLAGSGESGQAGSGPALTECSAFAADAVFLPSTQHCYLVDTELRTFAAAQEYCDTLHAHLVTISDDAEHDFAWGIHSEEHWIGAKDGKKPGQSGVGTYTWLTSEPFVYSRWSSNQPNASESDCAEGSAEDRCYEHCAFQWKGGEHDGLWNDRYCLHTIASICEWDSRP